jgi:hypothetical protein
MSIEIGGERHPETLDDRVALFAEIDARLGHIQWLETGRQVALAEVDWSLVRPKAARERAKAIFTDTEKRFAGYRQSITAAKERT